jgi:hypothetical protein
MIEALAPRGQEDFAAAMGVAAGNTLCCMPRDRIAATRVAPGARRLATRWERSE